MHLSAMPPQKTSVKDVSLFQPVSFPGEKTSHSTSCRQAVFANAIRTARTIVKTFGQSCEVAVHDFRDLEHSLIHIEGVLTGRQIGAPITNIVTKAWRQDGDGVEDILAYPTKAGNGRTLKSSTNFLRDDQGHVVGALCINFDITDLEKFQASLQSLVHIDKGTTRGAGEHFARTVGENSEVIFNTAVKRLGKLPATMTREEKVALVRILDEEGAFLIKGMVQYAAKGMDVSIYTIYNYLRQVKNSSS